MCLLRRLTASYKKGASVLLEPLQAVSTICITMKLAKLFAISLLAVLFESALVQGGYVESGQCEVIIICIMNVLVCKTYFFLIS